MKKVRWGVLSTASIAQKEQIPAFLRSTNAVVTSIATGSSIEKAHEVAQHFSIEKTYDSYEQLLDDPDIDAVYIPLPNHLHKQWVIEAAKKGKHILCEKPAAISAAEVREMEQACNETRSFSWKPLCIIFIRSIHESKRLLSQVKLATFLICKQDFRFI